MKTKEKRIGNLEGTTKAKTFSNTNRRRRRRVAKTVAGAVIGGIVAGPVGAAAGAIAGASVRRGPVRRTRKSEAQAKPPAKRKNDPAKEKRFVNIYPNIP